MKLRDIDWTLEIVGATAIIVAVLHDYRNDFGGPYSAWWWFSCVACGLVVAIASAVLRRKRGKNAVASVDWL